MVNEMEKEQDYEREEKQEESSIDNELLQLKKDFAKEYFEKLQKDQGFSLSGLLLSGTGVIEDYLTTEQNFLDNVKDNAVKEFVLKNALTDDILSQLENIKLDINTISDTNKEDVEKKLEELRVKYKLQKETSPGKKSDDTEKLDSSVVPVVSTIGAGGLVSSAVESQKTSEYGSPFLDEKTGNPRKFKISSLFGKRIHPVTGEEHLHTGIDIAEEEGTPIQSMCDGVVTKNKKTLLGGREIYIKDATGKEFCYLHLSEKSPLAKGTIIKAGQEIGKVGNTGRSTGPHLHLTIKDHNKHIDPVKEFPTIFEKNVA